jgi:hypothetical protein
MDMHVPKTGKKEPSGGIDGARGFGNLNSRRGSDGGDASTLNEDSLIRLKRTAGAIDERDVGYRKLGG